MLKVIVLPVHLAKKVKKQCGLCGGSGTCGDMLCPACDGTGSIEITV